MPERPSAAGPPAGPGAALRAAAAPLALAVARLRHRPSAWLLVAGGTAVAVALLVVAVGGGALAGERAAARILRGGDPASRALRLTWAGGLPAGVDARARRTLAAAGGAAAVTHAVILQARTVGSRPVTLTGLAPLGRTLRLTTGRLPRRCGPVVCEVVQVGGPIVRGRLDGRPAQDLVLRVVGHATVRSAVALGFDPARAPPAAGPGGAAPAVLVGPAPGVEALPGLSGVYRTHVWSAPLRLAGVPTWRLGAVAARVARVRDEIERTSGAFALDSPLAALSTARHRAAAARRHVALVGGGAAALLLAFVVLAAGSLARGLEEERDRLRRRGGRGWQGTLLEAAECGWATGAGAVAGLAAGLAVCALRAHAAGVPAGGLIGQRVLGGAVVPLGVAGWIVVTGLLVAALRTRSRGLGRATGALALAAVAALALALARGGVAPAGVAGGGDPLPALLPLLACLAGAVLAAAAAAPVLRLGERAARGGPLSVRLAALGLARSPRAGALAVAFLAVTIGLAGFASAYAATLRRGERDEAAFRVPLAVAVTAGPGFTRPLAAAPPARWRALAGGGPVVPVLRTDGTIPGPGAARPLAVVGLPAASLPTLGGWRDGDSDPGRAALAARLAAGAPTHPAGPLVPAAARALSVRARSTGDALDVVAHLVTPAGEPVPVVLGTAGRRTRMLRAALPAAAARPLRLISLEASPSDSLLLTRGHQLAEGNGATPLAAARLVLGPVRAGATRVASPAAWTARGGLASPQREGGGGVSLAYTDAASGAALVGPAQPTDGRALPAVVDRATAREAGRRGRVLATVGGVRVPLRVVGSAARLPRAAPGGTRFALLDGPTLATAIDAAAPGAAAAPAELWLGLRGPGAADRLRAALRRPPLSVVSATFRSDVAAALRADPLGAELLGVLRVAALLGLALAVLGLLLLTAATLRDEGPQLRDLEAQGLAPAELRTHVRLRVALVAVLGLAGGLALGAVLVALVTGAVQVTATVARPEPPLVADLPWPAWALGAVAFAALAATAVGALTRGAFRERA